MDRKKAFTPHLEDVKRKTENIITAVIRDSKYEATQVQNWVDKITHECIDYLQQVNDDFKYVVSVIIMEKKTGGFHLFSTCYWDCDQDGTVTARYDNPGLHVLVTIFGITLD
ncbi:tctex-1 family protein [Gregarina niphandrodes]|uniref:Tctex-1 family protein n=1 Tax=Gregarina niphandrodes TaxID=110365 RepID=A0A023AYQ0_GRENI|nr:tctex-1 family protein [Gregarina niphandrodes]EZG43796.1 tctex-1 family protein [Gregarina niphandrodes]|eukprot:XP_011133006.1 tctex-1 family protein [Gregarina niphandrodes]